MFAGAMGCRAHSLLLCPKVPTQGGPRDAASGAWGERGALRLSGGSLSNMVCRNKLSLSSRAGADLRSGTAGGCIQPVKELLLSFGHGAKF